MRKSTPVYIFCVVIPLVLLTVVSISFSAGEEDKPRAVTAPQVADAAEAVETLGQAVRDFRNSASNFDAASVKMNRLLDRLNSMMDQVERGEIYMTVRMSIGETKPVPAPGRKVTK